MTYTELIDKKISSIYQAGIATKILQHMDRIRKKDILSVINQVSSKNPDESTIGQFGTGFMTTYMKLPKPAWTI